MLDLKTGLIDVAIALQTYVTVFVAIHDWIPLGCFNDVKAVRAAESAGRLLPVTILSTLPFASCAVESTMHKHGFPGWLITFLWTAYGVATYGLLRTWWMPYLLFEEPDRAARYKTMHGASHAFLPFNNGMRPNTLHVTAHLAVIAMLVDLVALSFAPV